VNGRMSHRLSGHKSPVATRQVETDANSCLSSRCNSQRPSERRGSHRPMQAHLQGGRNGPRHGASLHGPNWAHGSRMRCSLGPQVLQPLRDNRAVGRGSPRVGCANPFLDAQPDKSNAGTRRFGRRSRHQADPCRSRATASAVGPQRHPPRRR
jgi:hypothetical protein